MGLEQGWLGGRLGCCSPTINSMMEMMLLAPWSPIWWEYRGESSKPFQPRLWHFPWGWTSTGQPHVRPR